MTSVPGMHQFYVEVGHRLRKSRERCGLSQRKLAEQLGFSDVAVHHWETAERYPNLWVLRRIEEVTGQAVVR